MISLDDGATLYSTVGAEPRKIRSGPLRVLLVTAMRGHEGFYEDMLLVLDSGRAYKAGEIRRLSRRLAGKRWYWPF